MAIKFEKIQDGMILYDVRKNTGFGRDKWNVWPVKIVSVDKENRTVLASWNNNPPRIMYERTVTKLRANRPKTT